jgi:hypothetical protein
VQNFKRKNIDKEGVKINTNSFIVLMTENEEQGVENEF